MNQYLEKALTALTKKCNITALHPLDDDLIKLNLKVLNSNGIVLDSSEIEDWLTSNHWQSNPKKCPKVGRSYFLWWACSD